MACPPLASPTGLVQVQGHFPSPIHVQQTRCMVFVPCRFSQAWHIFGQHARDYSTMSSAPTTRLGLLISPTCCLLPNAATAPNLHRALPCMAPQIKLSRAPLRYAQLVLRPTPGPLGINSAACTEHSSPVHHHSSCHVFSILIFDWCTCSCIKPHHRQPGPITSRPTDQPPDRWTRLLHTLRLLARPSHWSWLLAFSSHPQLQQTISQPFHHQQSTLGL